MMDAPVSLSGFIVALLLPWLVGIICARPLFVSGLPGRRYVIAGFGYFLGSFLSTLLIRLADALGTPLDFSGLAIALGLFGLLMLIAGRMEACRYKVVDIGEEAVPPVARAIVGILIALLAWRYFTMLGIIVERPLFGWDAMMNWAPKAIVWFHNGELTDFVGPQAWLQEATAAGPYTLGNTAASTYPEMVPLIFLWHMLGAGVWDHPLLQLPWLLAAINLGLALYGLMRMAGVGMFVTSIGCYFLLSLPYLNIHTVLGGYADLWLAAVFGLGVICLNEWEQRGRVGMALAALLAAVMCMQLKNPGMVLGLMLLLGMIRIKLALAYRAELLILVAGVVVAVLVFALGLTFKVPGVGLVSLTIEQFRIGLFGPHELKFHSQVTAPVLRSLFDMGNWHLLWYLALLIFLWIVVIDYGWRRPGTLAAIVVALAMCYFAVFFFTSYQYHAVSMITLNRAILYVIPALVFWLFGRFAGEKDRFV